MKRETKKNAQSLQVRHGVTTVIYIQGTMQEQENRQGKGQQSLLKAKSEAGTLGKNHLIVQASQQQSCAKGILRL